MKVNKIVRTAIIAALYIAITVSLAPFSYGLIQVRVSEALTVLPFIFPESMWGLFLGCLIANLYGGFGWIDIVFGSLATLIAAYLTSKMPTSILAPLPPVLVNAVIIGFVLKYVLGTPLLLSMGYVAVGQIVSCYALGLPLLYFLKKYKEFKWDEY